MNYMMISHYSEMFRRLIKNGNYEKYVLEIMNKSKTIFSNIHVSPNEEQPHGESDFVDQDGNKYEAKLIIDKRQGEIIGQQKNDINDWIKDMIKECSEISDISSYMDNCFIKNTKLYKIIKERIHSIKTDEIGILFIPFPIAKDSRDMIINQFAVDFLQSIIDILTREFPDRDTPIYYIYPSLERDVYVIRDEKYHREYIECESLNSSISYNVFV